MAVRMTGHPVRHHRAGRRDGERGVSVVIVALLLTVLLTASAFAVDLGAAFTERRHDQNTVDAAVMSAAVESVLGADDDLSGTPLDEVVDEVVAKVDTTLGRTVDTAAWEACTDSDALARTAKSLSLSPATDCISFSIGYSRVRVKLPDQKVQGVFGPALGFGQIETRAEAEAEVQVATGTGAPPFIALENATKGDFVCLRTGGNVAQEPIPLMQGNGPGPDPHNKPSATTIADPCDPSQYPVDSSTFGTVKPHAYHDACAQRDEEVKIAIAVGMDHVLGIFPNGYDPDTTPAAEVRLDGANNCTMPFPNTLEVDTGFSAQNLRCALVSLTYGDLCENEYPRLRQGDNVQSTYTVVSEPFDNVPPWSYLRNAIDLHNAGAPLACRIVAAARPSDSTLSFSSYPEYQEFRNAYPNNADSHWDAYDMYDFFIGKVALFNDADGNPVESCINAWEQGDPELFVEEIGVSPRFAFIPQVAEATLTNNSTVHIEGFLPVFLFRMYIEKNNSFMCDPLDGRATNYMIHDAGHTYSCGGSSDNISRLSSLVFACGMVPDSLCDKETGHPEVYGRDIFDIRLRK